MLEKTLESPLDSKEIKPINCKGNQSWIFIGRTDAEAETPILWPPDSKSQLTRKHHDAGKDWRQEEKGMTENEMVGCYHWLNGDELEQTPGDGDGQGSQVCCTPWGHKELGITEWLNNRTTLVAKSILLTIPLYCTHVNMYEYMCVHVCTYLYMLHTLCMSTCVSNILDR